MTINPFDLNRIAGRVKALPGVTDATAFFSSTSHGALAVRLSAYTADRRRCQSLWIIAGEHELCCPDGPGWFAANIDRMVGELSTCLSPAD